MMSSFRRSLASGQSTPEKPEPVSTAVPRPQIWAEGRQNPKFDYNAFVLVGQTIAARKLAPQLQSLAASMQRFADRVRRGEVRFSPAWAKRLDRLVPSHDRVGRIVQRIPPILRDAGALLLPPAPAPETLAFPDLLRFAQARPIRPSPRPVRLVVPAPAKTAALPPVTQETLALNTIRALIAEDPGSDGVPKQPTPQPIVAPAAANAGPIAKALQSFAATVLAWASISVYLPYGAVKAMILHLDGQDLRDWN